MKLRDNVNLRMVIYGIIQNRPPAKYRTTTERVTDVLDAVDRAIATPSPETGTAARGPAPEPYVGPICFVCDKPSPPGIPCSPECIKKATEYDGVEGIPPVAVRALREAAKYAGPQAGCGAGPAPEPVKPRPPIAPDEDGDCCDPGRGT